MRDELLTTAEAARALGVKRETVYAYVSRGLLERHASSGHRRSLFERGAVERLAGAARRPGSSDALEVVVETEITSLDPAGRLAYRGHDAVELARFGTFERAVALLWDGEAHAPWELAGADPLRAFEGMPGAVPLDRLPLIVAAAGASAGEAGGDRRPDAVGRAGARMFAGLLEALGEGRPRDDRSAAARLWPALGTGEPARPVQRAALDAALVLLADHELAASTLAARVAASAWADPYRVVLAGLGPLGGTLHGAHALGVEELLASGVRADGAFAALERRLATSGSVPGFGHAIYHDRDPRADHLLGRIAACATDAERARTVAAFVEAAAALELPAPNADFALAGLLYAMGAERGSASLVFTVARIAGLLAHALEEYRHRLRFRPRARYVGVPPKPGAAPK